MTTNYIFEFLVPYTLTPATVGLLVRGQLWIGFEIRQSDGEIGGCVGLIVANRWIGWTEVIV